MKSILEDLAGNFEKANYWLDLKTKFSTVLQQKNEQIEGQSSLESSAKKHLLENIAKVSQKLNSAKSLDELFIVLADFFATEEDKSESLGDLLYETVFYKLFSDGSNNDIIQKITQAKSLSQGTLLSIINLFDEPIRHHIMDFRGGGSNEHWSGKVVNFFAQEANKKTLENLEVFFNTTSQTFKKDTELFTKFETNSGVQIEAIPDRGFIGEMSGYIANACYTGEKSMLKNWDVVPYKLIDSSVPGSEELIGTVLFFTVVLDSGEKAILVRAFNIPKENEYPTIEVVEKMLDYASEVAKRTGCQKVLVPGLDGAISNYVMTTRHILQTYCENSTRVKLRDAFAFNNYPLTDSCYVARNVS